MKTTDFIVENEFIGDDAHAMHKDHEVSMAKADCYHAAKSAIQLHKILKTISERDGIDAWVFEKLTLANDYLSTALEYLEYHLKDQPQELEVFDGELAESKFNELMNQPVDESFGFDDFEVDGYHYQPWEETDGDTRKIFHTVIAPDGQELSVDWGSRRLMKPQDLKLWIELGMPKRISRGPLTREDLITIKNQQSSGESVAEGWKDLAVGGAMALGALGAGNAQAADLSNYNTQYLQQIVSGEHQRPMVSIDDAKAELQARANGKQQGVTTPAKSEEPKGFSKEYLQKAADPNRFGRYLISVEKAQELLNKMQEGVAEGKTGPGLWANIHAKQNRIKHGSGEHMRKPGSKGAPTAANFKAAKAGSVKEDLGENTSQPDSHESAFRQGFRVGSQGDTEQAKRLLKSVAPDFKQIWIDGFNKGLASEGHGNKPSVSVMAEESDDIMELNLTPWRRTSQTSSRSSTVPTSTSSTAPTTEPSTPRSSAPRSTYTSPEQQQTQNRKLSDGSRIVKNSEVMYNGRYYICLGITPEGMVKIQSRKDPSDKIDVSPKYLISSPRAQSNSLNYGFAEDQDNSVSSIEEELDKLLAEMSSASVATVPAVGKGENVGTLFGGSYAPATPFNKKKKSKAK
jgi:hypothetical protein